MALCGLVAACGRFGYDALVEGDGGSSPPGDAAVDAIPAIDADPGPACTTGAWTYHRPVAVQNDSVDPLDDYQVEVVVDTASLIAAGKLRPDCADVAFALGGTLVADWLESGTCGTAATSFWVRLASLPPGALELTLLYGDAAAGARSDGPAVFLAFDDFDDGDLVGWTAYTVHQQGGDGADSEAATTEDSVSPAYSLGLSAEASCLLPPYDGFGAGVGRSLGLPVGNYSVDFSLRGAVLGFAFTTSGATDFQVISGGTTLAAARIASCSGMDCTAGGAWMPYRVPVDQLALDDLQLEIDASDCTTSGGWYDDVRVRRRATPEPHGAVTGAEGTCR